MSTAWYRNCVPQMVRSFPTRRHNNLTVQVWDTSCVVSNMPPEFDILINPANPQLSGVSQFVYFPVGGPQPPADFKIGREWTPLGFVSQWGGMEVGDGMMFAANVVDGLVHQLGGKELQAACQEALQSHPNQRLSQGQAIATRAVGNLREETPYKFLVHAVPPFCNHKHNTDIPNNVTTKAMLAATYHSALNVAAKLVGIESSSGATIDSNHDKDDDERIRIATPLLGAGCRGFPVDVAIEVAVEALLGGETAAREDAVSTNGTPLTLAFGIPSGEIRELLVNSFDRRHDQAKQ